MSDTLRRECVGVEVVSLSDGNMLVRPFYDERRWNMQEEDGRWYGYPGFLTRMALASAIENVLNEAIGIYPDTADREG